MTKYPLIRGVCLQQVSDSGSLTVSDCTYFIHLNPDLLDNINTLLFVCDLTKFPCKFVAAGIH